MSSAYCQLKTYVTSGPGGRWDEIRGCKEILKDFTDGRLLVYVAVPPAGDGPRCWDSTEDAWRRETENLLLQYYPKFAERLALLRMHKLAVAGESSDAPPREVEAAEGEAESTEVQSEDALAAEIAAFMSAEQQSVTSEVQGSAGNQLMKREHKRMKTWGKKGRKLRDKDPYGDKLFQSNYLTVDDSELFYHHNYQHVTSNQSYTRKTGGTVLVSNKLLRRQLQQQQSAQEQVDDAQSVDTGSHILLQLEQEREHMLTNKVHVKNRSIAPANKSVNLTNAKPINTRL